jgi:hypothetical protein
MMNVGKKASEIFDDFINVKMCISLLIARYK